MSEFLPSVCFSVPLNRAEVQRGSREGCVQSSKTGAPSVDHDNRISHLLPIHLPYSLKHLLALSTHPLPHTPTPSLPPSLPPSFTYSLTHSFPPSLSLTTTSQLCISDDNFISTPVTRKKRRMTFNQDQDKRLSDIPKMDKVFQFL